MGKEWLGDVGVKPGALLREVVGVGCLPNKVIATARVVEDGRYAAQLRIQRALGLKGTYAAEEHWDQLGVFADAQEAVAHAKSFARDLLERAA